MPKLDLIIDARRAKRGANEFARAAGKITKNTKLIVIGATAAAAALAAAFTAKKIVDVLGPFQETLAQVRGVIGASIKEFKELSKVTRDLGATTRFSATEAAEGLLFLSRAGFSVKESTEALPSALLLAQAGVVDLGSAADITTNVLAQFGLQTENAANVVDILIKAANSANTDVSALADALRFVGATAAKVDISLEETAAVIGILGDNGIAAGQAGRIFRQVINKLVAPTEEARKTFEKLGIEFENINLETNSLSSVLATLNAANIGAGDAARIFTSEIATGAGIIIDAGTGFDKLTAKIKDNTGVAKKLADLMDDTLVGSLKSFKSATEEAFIALGADTGLGQGIKDVIDESTNLVRALVGVEIDLNKSSVAGRIFKNVLDTVIDTSSDFASELVGTGNDAVTVVDIIIATFKVLLDNLKIIFTTIIESWELVLTPFQDEWSAALNFILKALKGAGNSIIAVFDAVIQIVIKEFKLLSDVVGKLLAIDATSIKAAKRTGKAFIDAFVDAVDPAKKAKSISKSFEDAFKKDFIGDLKILGGTSGAGFLQGFIDSLNSPILSNAFEKILKEADLRASKRVAIERKKRQEEDAEDIAIKTARGETDEGTTAPGEIIDNVKLEESKGILGEIGIEMEQIKDLALGIGDTFAQSFENAIFEATSLKDFMKSLLEDVTRLVFNILVTQQLASAISGGLGGLFGGAGAVAAAKGMAVNRGAVIPFQSGGIVTRPTTFGLSRGRVGVMGESGPEAILPLKKGPGGRLGVEAGGGGGTVINFNVTTPDADSFRKSKRQLAGQMNSFLQNRG